MISKVQVELVSFNLNLGWSDFHVEQGPGFLLLRSKLGESVLKTRSKIEVHKDFCRIALGTHFAKTLRSIISNYLYRLHKPHFHILIAKGPNFKFSLESPGQILLDVGKSYKPAITIPHGVSVRLSTKRTLIFCTSCSTTVLSNFIASLKRQRPYNPYTGTGIFFKGLRLKLKVGKKK